MVYRYCRTCKQPKPPRTHHCSACKKCYMRMDHHCPWVGSCVAYGNHKLFVLFLFYTAFGCLYAALTMGLLTWTISRQKSSGAYFEIENKNTHQMERMPHAVSIKQKLLLGSTLPTVLFLAISMLLITHLYFTFASQCSVEAQTLQMFNPFFEDGNDEEENGGAPGNQNAQKPCCASIVNVKNFE